MLYDDSLKYLNKSLVKLRKGYNINLPLINEIGKTFILGNNYLIISNVSNVSRIDPQQVRHIEQILIKLIKKIFFLKKTRINIQASSTYSPPTSGSPTSGSPASGSPASGFPVSGFPASGFHASGFPAYGFPASGSPASSFPAYGFPAYGSPSSSFPVSNSPA